MTEVIYKAIVEIDPQKPDKTLIITLSIFIVKILELYDRNGIEI